MQHIQQKLLTLGYPVPTVSGAWGDNSAAALAKFQEKMGLDPGGDLDELTLLALEMPQVLQGEMPPGADAPVTAQAASSGGAPFSLSPRLTRVLQNKLTEAGYPTDNVFGIWMAGSDAAVRAFQKAKGLEITSTLDLRIIHTLGLTSSLIDPKPGKLPTDSVAQILADKALVFTGAPVFIGPAGIRQSSTLVPAAWTQRRRARRQMVRPAVGRAQEVSGSAEARRDGQLNLRTLKALGFNQPLADIDQQAAAVTRTGHRTWGQAPCHSGELFRGLEPQQSRDLQHKRAIPQADAVGPRVLLVGPDHEELAARADIPSGSAGCC